MRSSTIPSAAVGNHSALAYCDAVVSEKSPLHSLTAKNRPQERRLAVNECNRLLTAIMVAHNLAENCNELEPNNTSAA
jgi:hypothetical protein